MASLGISRPAWCAEVRLGWNPVFGDARVTGYEVHYGRASRQYQWVVAANDNGAATGTKTVENLVRGNTYFFAVRSRNHDASMVSAFSNEVSATVECRECLPSRGGWRAILNDKVTQ
jgi:cobyric acid synthase